MKLLEETIHLAALAGVNAEDIRGLGLTWRWYIKVRDGAIKNPGVNHVLALKELAEKRIAAAKRKGRAA